MSGFEKRYGITETDEIKAFHRTRRMFAIYKDQLYIAEKDLDYSHAEWFKHLGWMDESNDTIMQEIVRGYTKDGVIFFYTGYDFAVDSVAIEIMHTHIAGLAAKLNLNPTTRVKAGAIFAADGTSIERVDLGHLVDFLGNRDRLL